jgi:hypothetical protein
MIDAFAGLVVKKGRKPIIFDLVGNCVGNVSKFNFKLVETGGKLWKGSANPTRRASPTDVTEDTIRDYVLKHDLADVKGCAVSEEWSRLKQVVRKERR